MADIHTSAAAVFKPSNALSKVGPSAISRMMAATAELSRQGRDIVGLHVGEPDFDTPENIQEAAIKAMRAGDTHYTALDGSPAIKAAVREKFKRENGLDFTPEEIVVTTGAKMLLFSAFFATIQAGDEVILPAPYWVSYSDIVEMMGATPIILQTRSEDGFRLRANPDLDWIKLANGMGIEAARATTMEECADLMQQSFRQKAPFLIDLII